MSSGQWMTAVEYAVHRGCSDSFVRRLRRQGRLVTSADGRLIDVVQSDALLDETNDPLRGGDRTAVAADSAAVAAAINLPESGGPNIKEAVRRERLAKARLAELDLGEQAADLTRRREVHRAVFTLARQAMERLGAMGSRLGRRLASETEPAACAALIDEEVAQICKEMQRQATEMGATGTQAVRSAA
jgi:hypothetical protein